MRAGWLLGAAALGAGLLACGAPDRPAGSAAGGVQPAGAGQGEAGGAAGQAGLQCPPGAELAELSIDATDTRLRWCEKQGSEGRRIQHGLYEKRQGGQLAESGSFLEGRRHGRWILHWRSGPPQSAGEYRYGRRVGVWTYWKFDGQEIRRVDYGESGAEETSVADAAPESLPTQPPAGLSLRVENARESQIVLTLEPGEESAELPPGESVRVHTLGRSADEIRVEASEDGIRLWAGDGAWITPAGSPAPEGSPVPADAEPAGPEPTGFEPIELEPVELEPAGP